ncbi:hypothetical protein [Asanoa iriomotensis]|uniref:Dolichyl-phosphate-mannose-protein mannosyltransferase n=1 Tax=Asanoa iriomotensis TaxID=234613 RepID=A0ABQ4C2S0_9ACTN|nr:hypothetical protein [Asanoa iriomotensis]GIF57063.1 hypothetical protein Air01nite_31580 [Asanoa iriomotensis]
MALPGETMVVVRPRPVDDPPPRRWRVLLGPVALVLLTLVVHDVPTAVRLPYWLDEAWVAASTRFPIGDLPVTTSSTPIGWSALLRLVPDPDWLRLLPLGFLVLSVVAAYALAAALPWPSGAHRVVAGFLAGALVALLPAQQVRHDLKQYTADAALALVLLALAGFVEATYSRRRLVLLVAAGTVGVLLSHTATLVGGCVVGGLVLAALARRQWRRAVEAAVAGLALLAVFVAVYFGLARGGDSATMVRYWKGFFPTVGELPGYLDYRLHALQPYVGVDIGLLLVLALVGVVTVGLLGRPAAAVAAGLLAPAAVAAGVARMYPLLDVRTSHFLLVWLMAFAAIGVAGLATFLARRRAVVAGALAVVLLGGYAYRAAEWFRFDGADAALGVRVPATSENTRRPVAYVWAHRRPGDVVLVSGAASYGFAFYWPAQPGYRRDRGSAVGWQPTYPDPRIVLSTGRTAAAIHTGVVTATGLAGEGAAVWVVRSHLSKVEKAAWTAELTKLTAETTPTGVESALRVVAW